MCMHILKEALNSDPLAQTSGVFVIIVANVSLDF